MPLYKGTITIEFEIVVEADTEKDALNLAKMYARDEMDQYSFDYIMQTDSLHKINEKEDVEEEWLSGIPYGHERGMTVKQILEEGTNEEGDIL